MRTVNRFLSDFPRYLLYLILFNFFIIVLGVILVYLYNLSSLIHKKRNDKLKAHFIEMLRVLILDKMDIELSDLKPFINLGVLRVRQIREIFIETLTEYYYFLDGNEAENISKIYRLLGLHKNKIKDLSSINNSKTIHALAELTRFKIKVKREIMVGLQKSNNSIIRELANVYTLTIYDDNIYDFFNFNNYPFTKWKSLTYFQTIINRTDLKKPHFQQWISLQYKQDVVMLAMDLASYYYQHNAAEKIHPILNSPNHVLRFEMINNLGKLNYYTSPGILMKLYDQEKNMKCKIEIIKSLGYITHHTEEITEFLETNLEKEIGINLKKAIIIALTRTKSKSTLSSISFPEMSKEIQIHNP